MFLNTIQPGKGARKKGTRLGRGIGSGLGKTCGRGHKGQKARAGGYHKVGFEGGQMPLQRRLPKFGFRSKVARTRDEIRLNELDKLKVDVIDFNVLLASNLIKQHIKVVKVIASGTLSRPITLQGITVTKGARAAIEAAGGRIE